MRVYSSIRQLAIAICLITGMMTVGSARAHSVNESQLKVALIYNFILFTEWPASAIKDNKNLTICAKADSELAASLMALEVRSIRNRQLRIQSLTEPADYTHCEVLYIDGSDRTRVSQIEKKLDRKSVLTILSGEDFSSDGAIIALSLVNGRIVFDVNVTAAQNVQLVISSKLLRLARKVQ